MNPTEATSQLFQLYGDEVYRYVRFTLGKDAEAEDVVQEIFVQVLKSWDRFEYRSDPKTWLWAITNNTIKKVIRRKRYKALSMIDLQHRDKTSSQPDFFIDFENALRKLPYTQQQVFIQRVVHDMSSAQTAEVLGWSESKVKVTLHRAMKRLQSWLSEEGDLV